MYTVLSTEPALLPSPAQTMGVPSRSVAESEALETLRLFLQYKYGVLFEIPAA